MHFRGHKTSHGDKTGIRGTETHICQRREVLTGSHVEHEQLGPDVINESWLPDKGAVDEVGVTGKGGGMGVHVPGHKEQQERRPG